MQRFLNFFACSVPERREGRQQVLVRGMNSILWLQALYPSILSSVSPMQRQQSLPSHCDQPERVTKRDPFPCELALDSRGMGRGDAGAMLRIHYFMWLLELLGNT